MNTVNLPISSKIQYLNKKGADNRPLYILTSEEDPNNPIVRDSSTGCWVYVCQRVNEISEHKYSFSISYYYLKNMALS